MGKGPHLYCLYVVSPSGRKRVTWTQEEEAERELTSQYLPAPLGYLSPRWWGTGIFFSSEQTAMGPTILGTGLTYLGQAWLHHGFLHNFIGLYQWDAISIPLKMTVGIHRAGNPEGLPDLIYNKELYCSWTQIWMAFPQKTLSLIPWLCANKEIGQDLWKLPKTCHTEAKTILKQMKLSWAYTDSPYDSITFKVKEYFSGKNKWTLPLSLCVDSHLGRQAAQNIALSSMRDWCRTCTRALRSPDPCTELNL